MRTISISLMTFVTMLCAPGTGFAQPAFRGAVAAAAGAGTTWDDEGKIGSGVLAGGRVEWRLFGRTFAEGSVHHLRHARRTGVFEAEGRTVLVSASLVQRFGRGAAQPYGLSSVVLARHDGTAVFPPFGPMSTSSTDPGLSFGGGVAIAAGERWEVGPEARFMVLRTRQGPAPAYAYWIGARVGVRF